MIIYRPPNRLFEERKEEQQRKNRKGGRPISMAGGGRCGGNLTAFSQGIQPGGNYGEAT